MTRDYGEYSSTYSLSTSPSKQVVLEGERKLSVKVNELPAARRADYDSFRNVTRSNDDQLLSCSILTPSGKETEVAGAKMEELRRIAPRRSEGAASRRTIEAQLTC